MNEPGERRRAAPIRGVLFDLGGTLCEFRPEMAAATDAALARLGFALSDPAVLAAATAAMRDAATAFAPRPSYLHRDLFREQFARTAGLLGATADDALLDWFDAEHLAATIEHVRPRPDAPAVLEALRDRGVYCAVVSNADDDFLEPNLVRHGLDALLDDWTSSEDAASCKPDPVIFRHALAKSGMAVDEVLFVGDSLEHDVVGAAGIGMRSALIDNGFGSAPFSQGSPIDIRPDHEIRELTELVAIVDRTLGST